MSKGLKGFNCNKTEDGAFRCERYEKDNDGNRNVIGEMIIKADGNCKPVIESSSGSDTAMSELHEHMTKNINYNCERKQ